MPTFLMQNLESSKRWSLDLDGEVFLIGRSRTAQVCVRDRSVSKTHVRIERKDTGYEFRDLGSRNGTYVNDLRCERGPLRSGDRLRIGCFLVTFYSEKAEKGEKGEKPARMGEAPSELATAGATTAASATAGAATRDLASPPGTGTPAAESVVDRLLREYASRVDEDAEAASGPGEARSSAAAAAPGPKSGADTPSAERDAALAKASTPEARRASSLAASNESLATGSSRKVEPTPSAGPVVVDSGFSGRLVLLAGLCGLVVGLGGGLLGGWILFGASSGGEERVEKSAGPVASSPESQSDDGQGALARVDDDAQDVSSPDALDEEDLDDDPLFDPPSADFGDVVTAQRALRRLFVDLLGRPPTRDEGGEFLRLGYEERLDRALELASDIVPRPNVDQIEGASERFLGRRLAPAEVSRLRAREGSAKAAAVWIVSSRYYASAEHRRPFTREARAAALWVDILDTVPAREDTDTVLQALHDAGTSQEKVVRTIVDSAAETRGPGEGPVVPWIENLVHRVLGREPSAAEGLRLRTLVQQSTEGWRRAIAEVVLSPDASFY